MINDILNPLKVLNQLVLHVNKSFHVLVVQCIIENSSIEILLYNSTLLHLHHFMVLIVMKI